ncbi:RagB/SusD family nutrient uptake outer membrane protein [Parabacteroides sp. Marseille-P3160]|uniref:RagB/SusD family nutrient uptake outer membrane protein n=1 Tax=Parabacteroides sp. Marseille-P3160 TaxID=1917887 RepID=UPI0009B9A501|nr:RagB/SusD family nutrient uptake outer membrane protein [Parabacteroides sp. Marseille-P3160]
MKRMKYYIGIFLVSIIGITATSCEDYLDKAPESDISDKDAFGNFTSFQGFVEEMYKCIMDPDKGGAFNRCLFADETLGPSQYPFDQGNYWSNESYFFGQSVNTTDAESRTKRIWEYAWYAIRKANLALSKLEEEGLFEGTDEERNHLKGQALFFRGWFYFEICRYWGGMPYIDRMLEPTEDLFTPEFKRLNFQECAKKMAADFRAAADLLPNHWDLSGPGEATKGHNRDRINKFHALGYLGKALLYAASPMINEEATGNNAFDGELCAQAASAFGELLQLADQTGIYQMQSWDTWTDCFWRWNWERPGGTECIMMPIIFERSRVRWSTLGGMVPSSIGMNSGSSADVPTHNYIKNYAMANGLPIDDPASGYNPNDPWIGREPRFYKDILKDGDQIWATAGVDQYAQLYNGGRHRNGINPPSVTGYYYLRYAPLGKDFTASKADALQAYKPYLRLADIYLMYAEAVNFSPGGGPNAKAANYSMTAVEALNVVRNRAQLPNLDHKFTTSKEAFFEEIVRERAVELAFEGARFCDLRRWNRNGDERYLDKTALDFDRGENGKPINIRERVVIRRTVGKKHNWLPIQVKYTTQYEGFPQNPGW